MSSPGTSSSNQCTLEAVSAAVAGVLSPLLQSQQQQSGASNVGASRDGSERLDSYLKFIG